MDACILRDFEGERKRVCMRDRKKERERERNREGGKEEGRERVKERKLEFGGKRDT